MLPGRFVGQLQEARGELAERTGKTQLTGARPEAGNISPSLPTLDKVAEALGAELVVSSVDLDERGRRLGRPRSQHVRPCGGSPLSSCRSWSRVLLRLEQAQLSTTVDIDDQTGQLVPLT